MKMLLGKTALEAAKERINRIYDEFDNVVVSMSGGKDSTVCFNLTMEVAKERGRLPLKVTWLDQECEFQSTVDYMREVMYRDDVEPHWLQMPFRLLNATSSTETWLHVWGPEDKDRWVREQDPISIKENIYGTDRFVELCDRYISTTWKDVPTANIIGLRAEESPNRFMGLTGGLTYKDITWGKVIDSKINHYNFAPLYDWNYIDIWKAIYDHGWDYCAHYDHMYRYGVKTQNMRVSNYHHETAVQSLFLLQEIEPEMYNKATQRISGLDTAGKMGDDDYFAVKELPFMFKTWTEYRDYLLENLIVDPEVKASFVKIFKQMDSKNEHEDTERDLCRVQINSILCNDVEHTKLKNYLYKFSDKRRVRQDAARQEKAKAARQEKVDA